jgi:transposase
MLRDLKGAGPEFVAVLWSEGLFRHFDNWRQVAACVGLAPTPRQSGSVDREQGVSKAENPRLRATIVLLARPRLRHQPKSAWAEWLKQRVDSNSGRPRKTLIAALAPQLLAGLLGHVYFGDAATIG